MVSAELSKSLREKFPTLTVKRLEHLRQFVVNMMPGDLMLPDADLIDPDEVIICLYVSVEEASRDRIQAALTIRGLSAARKRRAFPRSYGAEKS